MKSIILGMISPGSGDILIGNFPVNRTGMIHVRQRCDNCEKHIVKVAQSVEGVLNAEWNKKSNVLIVEFDSQKTNLKKIELAIAEEGHDTPNYKGTIKYYAHIPACCQYHLQWNKERS